MTIQPSATMTRELFVSLWLRSVFWGMIYGSALGALAIVLLVNGLGFLVWTDVVPSNNAFEQFSSTLDALLVYIPFEIVIGALIGGGLGVLQGVITGLVIGRVTMSRFYPPTRDADVHHYRRMLGRLSIYSIVFITIVLFAGYTLVRIASDDRVLSLGDVLLVSGIAFPITYAAWCASQRVCHWYTNTEHPALSVE